MEETVHNNVENDHRTPDIDDRKEDNYYHEGEKSQHPRESDHHNGYDAK